MHKIILAPLTTHSTPPLLTLRTGTMTNYYKNYFSNVLPALVVFTFKLPQDIEEYIILPIILPSFADGFYSSFSLLTRVIYLKHTPVFGLLMRVCNTKGTLRVLLQKETAIYWKQF